MEDDGFFGFNSSLPAVRRGPQQELDDVELEDTYDALNDETFGVINADDDWEEEHEKLAEYIGELSKDETNNHPAYAGEECAYPGMEPLQLKPSTVFNRTRSTDLETESAANVAASMSQIILEDDDIDSIISRPIKYSGSIESKLFGHISPHSSIFDTDIVGSPSTPSIWSTQPSEMRKNVDGNRRKVSAPSPTRANGSEVSAVAGGHSLVHNGLFKTVEELERDLLKQPRPLTMEELERNILSQQFLPPTSGVGPVRSVEDIEAELTRGVHHVKPSGPIPHPPPPSFLRMPPPLGVTLPPLVSIPLPAGMRLIEPMGAFLPPQAALWPLKFPPNTVPSPMPTQQQTLQKASRSHENESRQTVIADDGYDDYAGLMSTKEKQWLMSIQINQLISDNPYVDDYYFTVLRLRCLGKLQQGVEGREGPKLIVPERVKTETRTYAPTQFANSLGKLQVVTYTAPRRIIDVSIAQPSPEACHDPLVAVKDMRKFKQILLDIEKMYLWLLALEDAEIRIECLPDDSDHGPHHQAAADYQHKLQTLLSSGDRLQQVLLVRKGKVLILRAWSRLTSQFQELIVKTILLNCLVLIRRDSHDQFLVRFLPLVNDVFASVENLEGLVSMAQLIDAAHKNNGCAEVISTKMGVDLISLMFCRGTELLPKCADNHVRHQWTTFIRCVGDAILATSKALQSDLRLLNLEPFKQAGMESHQLDALKTILDKMTKSARDS